MLSVYLCIKGGLNCKFKLPPHVMMGSQRILWVPNCTTNRSFLAIPRGVLLTLVEHIIINHVEP